MLRPQRESRDPCDRSAFPRDVPCAAPQILAERRVAGFHVAEIAATDAALLVPPPGISQISGVFRGVLRQPAAPAFELAAGGLAFTPPNVLRRVDILHGPVHVLVVRLDPDRLCKFQPLFAPPCELTTMALADLYDLPQRVVLTLRGQTSARDLALEAAILAMIASGAEILARRKKNREPFWLRRVDAYVDANLGRQIGLTDVAGAVRVARSTLADVFRQSRGMTIGDYIRRKRVESACLMLRKSSLPIAGVAAACGFCDQSHMTRAFRQELHTTPAGYRRLLQ
ncbi:MAG TPA: AraC family transcriptional regulator [Thermoanaerobaculia bacterium]|nr:AraC family transcriptional regulator [Thermoanaerobaculia bacterium]